LRIEIAEQIPRKQQELDLCRKILETKTQNPSGHKRWQQTDRLPKSKAKPAGLDVNYQIVANRPRPNG
jgi:hypothetical protein